VKINEKVFNKSMKDWIRKYISDGIDIDPYQKIGQSTIDVIIFFKINCNDELLQKIIPKTILCISIYLDLKTG